MKLRRRETGEEFEVEDGTLLGRVESCSVRVEDGSISRRHAQIEQRADGLWVRDLGSSNGTKLNGRKGETFRLGDGDLLTLGAVAFDVIGSPAERASEPPAELAAEAAADSAAEDPLLGETTIAAAAEASAGAKREEPSLAAEERARLRAEIRGAKRSRGLGDLGQQPLIVQIIAFVLGLALLGGVFFGIRYLGDFL